MGVGGTQQEAWWLRHLQGHKGGSEAWGLVGTRLCCFCILKRGRPSPPLQKAEAAFKSGAHPPAFPVVTIQALPEVRGCGRVPEG